MFSQKKLPIAFLLFLISIFPAAAQDWSVHVRTVTKHPDLIRYYLLDGCSESKNIAPNKDVADSDLVNKTQHPIEKTQSRFGGTELNAGWYESPKLGIDKAFSVEMRVQLHGVGSEKGNNGSESGTLFGLGNGWDSGIRLTTDCLRQTLTFSIGKPDEEKSRNAVGNQPVPYGTWTHIAAVWDGITMRIYVDGMLYALTDYDGKLTEPGWGFRIGYNDAGVGSVRMDVAEVAVYKDALPPEDILAHALMLSKLPESQSAILHDVIEAVRQKDFPQAAAELDTLLALDVQPAYRFPLRKFQAELAAMSGNSAQALRLYAALLDEPDLQPTTALNLMRRLVSSGDYLNPITAAPSRVYQKMLEGALDLPPQQQFALEKCYAQALFAEGKTAEAKKWLDGMHERERTFNRAELAKQNLSADFTELYKQYRAAAPVEPPKRTEFVIRDQNAVQQLAVLQIFVAPDGKATNSGSQAQPLATLSQARDAIRKMKAENYAPKNPYEVIVRGGVYPVTETFLLEPQDSGTEDAPILYRAAEGETPIFNGGVSAGTFQKMNDSDILSRLPKESQDKVRDAIRKMKAKNNALFAPPYEVIVRGGISAETFVKVSDTGILNRLPKESQGKVLVANIPQTQVEFPPAAPRGYGKNGLGAAPSVELFVNDKPMQIARYPNAPKPNTADLEKGSWGTLVLEESEGTFLKTGKVHRSFFETNTASQPGIFEYSDDRHERWTEAKDAMLFGYWGHLWAITSCRVEKIDPKTKQVVLATNNSYGHRENMPYYAFNLLEEIDEPGEWYLDRSTNKVYLYPPEGIDLNAAKVRLSCFPKEFIKATNVSNVTFTGLHFEEGTGTAIRVEGGDNVNFVGCSVKRFGNWGLGLSGTNNKVIGCDFETLGGGGIDLNGGEVKTLTPGNCLVENTYVYDFSRIDRCYAPAVALTGVGNALRYNLFCHSPGHAIRVEGMEHTIEFNEIHSIVYESDDQAGIDIWGNPFIRGMVFRYNYWHHIGSGRDVAGQSGIRLDDMISSVLIYGNIFYRASGGNFGGVQIHGGKDNIVDGNLMLDNKYAVSFSTWGEKRWLEQLDGYFGTRSRQSGFNPDSPVYKAKYSDYAELKLNADRNFVTRNAAIGCDTFANHGQRNVMSGNVMLPWMPELFKKREDSARLSIPQDSPIYKLLGIPPIPEESMGLYRDGKIRKVIPQPAITPFFVLE